MFPIIDKEATARNIKSLMKCFGLTPKDLQQYLHLGSVQSIYYWLEGRNLPTIDNLYALSCLFRVPMDVIVCGNGNRLSCKKAVRSKWLYTYYKKMGEMLAA